MTDYCIYCKDDKDSGQYTTDNEFVCETCMFDDEED